MHLFHSATFQCKNVKVVLSPLSVRLKRQLKKNNSKNKQNRLLEFIPETSILSSVGFVSWIIPICPLPQCYLLHSLSDASSFLQHSITPRAASLHHRRLILIISAAPRSFGRHARLTLPPPSWLLCCCISFADVHSRHTTWRCCGPCWRDKQLFHTGDTLSSKWQYFLLPAWADNWASFVPPLDGEAMFVTDSIWFSHMVTGCLVKPGAVLGSPRRGISFHVTNVAIHYVPGGLGDTLLWRATTHWIHPHFTSATQTSFVAAWNETEWPAYYCTITCPLISRCIFKVAKAAAVRRLNTKMLRQVPLEH